MLSRFVVYTDSSIVERVPHAGDGTPLSDEISVEDKYAGSRKHNNSGTIGSISVLYLRVCKLNPLFNNRGKI